MTTENKPKDPLHDFIRVSLAADGVSLTPQEIARAFWESRRKPHDRPDAWRKYILAVRQLALSMARQEEIVFLRKGKPANPEKVRGVVRLRLRAAGEILEFPEEPQDDDLLSFDDDGSDE